MLVGRDACEPRPQHRTSSSGLFHDSLNAAEAGQPAHDQFLSGHLPASAEVPLSKATTITVAYMFGAYRCEDSHGVPARSREGAKNQRPNPQSAFERHSLTAQHAVLAERWALDLYQARQCSTALPV